MPLRPRTLVPIKKERSPSPGRARSKSPEQAERIDSYRRFMSQQPHHRHLYQAAHFVGIEYFKQRKLRKALKYIRRSLKLNPAYADAWYNRALVEQALGLERKGEPAARRSFRRAQRVCESGVGVCSHTHFARDVFLQAVGVSEVDPRLFRHLRTDVQAERADILRRQTETESRFAHPNKATVLALLKSSEGRLNV